MAVAAKVLTKSERTTQTLDRYRCQSVGIRVDHEQKIELDGDIIGEATHVEVEVQPRALIVRTETGRAPAPERHPDAACPASALRTCARATAARTAAARCTAR